MLPLAVRALLLVILALVPAAIVQALLEQEAREERGVQVSDHASQLARLVAGQQARTLESVQHLMSAVSAHEAIRLATPNRECDAYLSRLLTEYPRFSAMSSVDMTGHTVCSAMPQRPEVSVAERPYFRSMMGGQAFAVGEFTEGLTTGQRTLHLASPLRDGSGAVIGGLVVGLSIAWLNDDLAQLQLPEGSAASIIDRRGVVLARVPEAQRFVGTRVPDFALAAATGGREQVLEGASLDGPRRIAAYMPVAVAPGSVMVVVGLSVEQGIVAQVERERRASLLVVGSLTAALMLAIGAFQLGVHKPVQKLMTTAQAWSAQNWTARIGRVGGGLEFDRIATALDAMADALQKAEQARLVASARVKALSEVSPQVVFTADAQGRIDWLNGYWRQLTGLGLAQSQGVGLLRAVHKADRRAAIDGWRGAVTGDGGAQEFNLELRLRRREDDAWRWFFCRAAPIRDPAGSVTSWAGVALDFHELRQAQEALAEQSERLRVTYQSAPIGLCLLDPQLRFLAVNAVLASANGATPDAHIGRFLHEMASPATVEALQPALQQLFRTGEPLVEIEVKGPPVAPPALRQVWLCNYLPVRGTAGQIVAATGSVLDISARKHAEETEQLLSREVDHRAKNVLAVVRSLVRVSAAEANGDVDSFVDVLEGRIAAMARVHTLLSRAGWNSAELGELARQETAVYARQVRTEDMPVLLAPEAAQPLTMVLHELVTNAAKYGALSVSRGTVTLLWWRDDDGIVLEWSEHGGPFVHGPPAVTGFGTQLIDGNASTPLDGSLVREWRPEGLCCTLRIGPGALAGPGRPR